MSGAEPHVELTPPDGESLLRIARGSVEASLGGPPLELPHGPRLDAPGAAFVTVRHADGRLHGCIGTLEAERPLGETVARNARLAAFDDPRSRALRPRELGEVRFEVSVLTEPVPLPVTSEADALSKLRPGIDGVLLEHGRRRGVFLPQVWESLPDGHDFLVALREKAGLPGDLWDDQLRLSVFQVEKFDEPGYERGAR